MASRRLEDFPHCGFDYGIFLFLFFILDLIALIVVWVCGIFVNMLWVCVFVINDNLLIINMSLNYNIKTIQWQWMYLIIHIYFKLTYI